MILDILDCNKSSFKNERWDMYFMDIAKRTSLMSKDPSTKVGAVITNGKHLVSVGYNGFPSKIADDVNYLLNREKKYKRIVHAEMNAILNADDIRRVVNSTLYLYPIPPCSSCAKFIVQSGIKEIVVPCGKERIPERWVEDMNEGLSIFRESGIKIRSIPYEID